MNAMAAVLSPLGSPPPAAPAARGNDEAGGGFARCLEAARDNESADSAEPSDAAQRPASPAPRGREATAACNGRYAARKADPRAATPSPTASAADADTASHADAATSPALREDAAAPDLAALLPGWTAPAVAVASAVADAPAADGADALPGAAAAKGVAPAAASRTATPLAAPAAGEAAAGNHNMHTKAAASAAPEASTNEQRDTLPIAASATPTAPMPVAFAAALSAPRPAEPALPTAAVPAPIDTPAFAPALATQVRWWAHDGMQQAQLLLNPAEMGPVAVKIVLDGREARIDFSADLAATRSAIEAALPVLAAALDDGGLKLCGGGVHDGSAQRQSDWHERSVTHRTAGTSGDRAGDALSAASAPGAAAARGLVDLVA